MKQLFFHIITNNEACHYEFGRHLMTEFREGLRTFPCHSVRCQISIRKLEPTKQTRERAAEVTRTGARSSGTLGPGTF